MKKIASILFALFYLTLTTKVNAKIHFCGGSITDISLFSSSNEDACECDEMTDNSCCNDVNIQCKIDDSKTNLLKVININFQQNFTLLFITFNKILQFNFSSIYTNSYYIFDNKPPNILKHLSAIFLRI